MFSGHMSSVLMLAAALWGLGWAVAMWAGWVKRQPAARRRPEGALLLAMALLWVPMMTPPAEQTGRWLAVDVATAVVIGLAGIIMIVIPGKRAPCETYWSSWRDRMTSLYGKAGVRRYLTWMSIGGGIVMLGAFAAAEFHNIHLANRFFTIGTAVMAGTILVCWSYLLYKKLRFDKIGGEETGASRESEHTAGDNCGQGGGWS